MNYFWGNVFEYFKDRRLGAVFFGTLAVLAGVPIVGIILVNLICAYDLQGYLLYAAPGVVLLLTLWIGRGIRQLRTRRNDRYKSSPLARDEIAKARSKLTTKSTFKSL